MNRVENAKRNISWGIVNKVVSILLPFILRTAIIHILGKEYLGLDSLFNSILQMLNIAELGFSSALVFSMYGPLAERNDKEVCALLALYKKVYRIIGGIVLAIGISVMPFLPKLIKSGLPDDVNLYSLYFVFLINTVLGYWLFAYKKSLLSACQREDIVSKITSAAFIGKICVQLLMIIEVRKYFFFIIIMPITTVIENLAAHIVSSILYPRFIPKGNVSGEVISSIITRIKGLFVSTICMTSRNAMDSIIISTYLGLGVVTLYGNYYYILSAIHSVLAIFTHSITAVVGNTVVSNSPELNHKDMMRLNFLYMWMASIASTSMLCTYQSFMIIWMGDGMILNDISMILFCIYFYSLCIGDVRSVYYVACGLWWEGRYRSILEATSNIILNIILGKYFGVNGIIIATLFSIIVINFGYGSSIIYKNYFIGISALAFYRFQMINAVVTAIIWGLCYWINSFNPLAGIIGIASRIIICFVVTNVLLFLVYHKSELFSDSLEFVKRRMLN